MAKTPTATLAFPGGCPDCGGRTFDLPDSLPEIGDDLDWLVRDYDGFRLFIMQELAARFPERLQWTPGDIEVVLVEVLAALLDQLSDMTDRVAAEATLETARRPESVRRLLQMIGYDAAEEAYYLNQIDSDPYDDPAEAIAEVEALWSRETHLMNDARQAGPRAIHRPHRMVTIDDYGQRMEDHPLVLRAAARKQWTGSWHTIFVTTANWNDVRLDSHPEEYPADLRDNIEVFHKKRGLDYPNLTPDMPALKPTIRAVLRPYLNAARMAGQEVVLQDPIPVPISMAFSIRVASNYFRAEITNAVNEVLGRGPSGFFRPGRLRFGEDLHVSDTIEVLMALDGVEHVCINRFKRLGSQFPDQTEFGRIELEDPEIAVCDNKPEDLGRGYWSLTLHGGRRG